MKFTTILLLPFLLFAAPVQAQIDELSGGKEGEVLSQPICSSMKNVSEVTIQGTLMMAPQTLKNDGLAQHRDNFKLAPGERMEFCASGPFFEGRRISLTIRTLMPLFECKTRITREIMLKAEEQDDGSWKYSADCF